MIVSSLFGHKKGRVANRRLFRLIRNVIGCALFVLPTALAGAQTETKTAPPDSLWAVELPVMVVTATRSEISLRDVPVPTKVVLADQIKKRGVLRLSDLLAEEPGLIQVHFLGSGIQIQGFDSDYTLVLIDGQPIIGRNGGTLDLDRFAVSNIESVEIVQGPSSSLYGSEALAGVINLRTKEALHPLAIQSGYRLQTHGTKNFNTSVESKLKNSNFHFNYDRYSSDGYDLAPETIGLTGPGFVIQSLSSRLATQFFQNLKATVSARFAHEKQHNVLGLDQSGVTTSFEENFKQVDYSVSPELVWKPSNSHRFIFRGYTSGFDTNSKLSDQSGDTDTVFEQAYHKIEAQHDLIYSSGLLVNSGLGKVSESVKADRISGASRSNSTVFAFSQQQWFLSPKFHLITSARLDIHTDYGSKWTPKVAAMYKPESSFRLRASIGSGFKAPSFQQLYMDFTNAVAGYSVIGAADAAIVLNQMVSQGQIQTVLSDPAAFSEIRPESSWAFNVSSDFDVLRHFHIHLALFRNNVRDLIETLPVALKQNGQNVFSYVNLNRIYTQGIVSEIKVRPLPELELTLGYQFLDARDRSVLDEIAKGNVFGRKDGRDYRLQRSDYGGLFNRSKHSGSLHLDWNTPNRKSNIQLRGVFRSRYGVGDLNGNLILDSDAEYVPGFSTWNVTANHSPGTRLTLQAGINNLFDYTNPGLVPSLSGRQFFVGLHFSTH